MTCVRSSVAYRHAHTCQIIPCSSCGIWMRCKTFSPELTAAKSWQKSNCAKKVRKVLRGTHTDFMRSPLYSIIRQGLKASLISPLLPLSVLLRLTSPGHRGSPPRRADFQISSGIPFKSTLRDSSRVHIAVFPPQLSEAAASQSGEISFAKLILSRDGFFISG